MAFSFVLLATALNFTEYLRQADAAFVESPQAQGLSSAERATKTGVRRIMAESPVQLNVTGSGSWYQPANANYPFPNRSYAWGSSASVSYLPRVGFAATLAGNYTYATLQNSTPATPSPTQPFNISLTLRYDVMQGGARSTAWLNAWAQAAQARAQTHTISQTLLDSRIGFVQLMTDIYAASCGIVLLSSMRTQIDQTVKAANIELETGILAQRDYFNFTTLDNSFASQQVQLEASLAQQRQQAHAFGARAARLAAELETNAEVCEVDIDATQALARERILSVEQIERWAVAFPASLGAQAAVEAATHNLQAVNKSLKPSISPFLNAQIGQPDYVMQPLAQITGGVSFDWTVPGARGSHATNEAAGFVASAHAQVNETVLQGRAQLLQLSAQLKYQAQVFEVLRKALKDSERLLKVLEAQKLIGQVDSLNFTTAYLNHVSLRQTLLSAWASVHKSVIALQIYEQAIKETERRER